MSDKHEQVAAQCRVVAHLATAIAQVHSDKAELMAANAVPGIVDIVGNSTAHYMERLGNILNGMDAVTEDDDWAGPVFREAQRVFPQPEEVTIPRAEYEAYEAAAKALHFTYHGGRRLTDVTRMVEQALAALRAAGIQTEGGGK